MKRSTSKTSSVAVLELSGVAVHEFRSEVVHELSSFRRSTIKLTWNVFALSQPGMSNGAVSVPVALA